MSFTREGLAALIPDAERFRSSVRSQMRILEVNTRESTAGLILKGYVYMTDNWVGIYNIKKAGTYRGMPVLSQYQDTERGIHHNDALLKYKNKEDAIQALRTLRAVLENIPAKVKFLRIDKLWEENSLTELGLVLDPTPPAKKWIQPRAVYALYLYINW